MSISWECCVLSGRRLCNGLITRPEEFVVCLSVIVNPRQWEDLGLLGVVSLFSSVPSSKFRDSISITPLPLPSQPNPIHQPSYHRPRLRCWGRHRIESEKDTWLTTKFLTGMLFVHCDGIQSLRLTSWLTLSGWQLVLLCCRVLLWLSAVICSCIARRIWISSHFVVNIQRPLHADWRRLLVFQRVEPDCDRHMPSKILRSMERSLFAVVQYNLSGKIKN
jgi:hypothetical protein